MSFFDKSTDGPLQQNYGSSESSGGVTPAPQTPTHGVSAQTSHRTPSPYYSRPQQSFVAGNIHGDASPARQSLLNYWDVAGRAGPQNTPSASTSSMPPPIVIQESTRNSDHGRASMQRRMASTPAHCRDADPQMDIQTGFARLRMADSVSEHAPASAHVPARPHGNLYPHPYSTHPSAATAIPLTVETRPPQRHFSMWSTYGSQPNPGPSRRAEVDLLSDPYVSRSGELPVRADAAALGQLRPSSEVSSSLAPASLPPPQRHFSTQLIPSTIPVRIGQSRPPHTATQPDRRGPSGGGGAPALNPPQPQPPGPFLIQPRNQGFLPMHAVHSKTDLSGGGVGMPPLAPLGMLLAPPRQPAPASRFSDRYHGMHTESNASADHLTPEQNASLWITNLPPDITHHELLGQIRRVGRVWCCFINGPDGVKHATAAAKIVFFQPAAAQRLLQQTALGGLSVRGWRAKVAPNRIKTGATVPRGGDDSRVLLVTGQAHFVNEKTLMRYFSERFVFQVDEVRELARGAGGRAVVEFRFGSYRCQAQMGKISLEKDRPLGFEKAEFGEDPCETGETWTSYSIALQRIQGLGL